MSNTPRALVVQLPSEIDFGTCDKFLKSKREMRDAIDEIISRQKKFQFFAKNKFNIDAKLWEEIYREIIKSPKAENQNTNPQLTPKYVSKNHMVYGDALLVLLFTLQVHGGVLGLTNKQIKDFSLELETKIYGINPILLHQNFLKQGGRVIRQGLFTDLEFDTLSRRLKGNGGCKIRTRERDTIDDGFSEELTGKRKLSAAKHPKKELLKLNKLLDDMESPVEITSFSDDMKVLFEEPHIIFDHGTLKEIFKILRLYIVSAKTKLRTSGVLESAKLENENIFWAKSSTGIVDPFAELEASSPEVSQHIREILGIADLPIGTQGTEDALVYLGAEGQHMKFMQKGVKKIERAIQDNYTFQLLLTRKALGRQKIQEGFFNDYPKSLLV